MISSLSAFYFLKWTALLLAAVLLPRVSSGFFKRFQRLTRNPVLFLFLLTATTWFLAWISTPQINFGSGEQGLGYGHDGAVYGWMSEHFAWFKNTAPNIFCYRILPSFLVHVSGLPTFTGFHVLNFLSFTGSCILFYNILRFYKIPSGKSILGTAFFATLKFGLKFWIYYPVTTDGLGTFLMMALLYSALKQNQGGWLISLLAAVFCRENLLAVIPFYLIAAYQKKEPKEFKKALGLQILPVVLFVLSRKFPVFTPASPNSSLQNAFYWLMDFLKNPARASEWILAYINTLGVLFFLMLFHLPALRTFCKTKPEWLYYSVITLILSMVGGNEVDRFTIWFFPFLMTALLCDDGISARDWLKLWILQIMAMELFLPWLPDAQFHCSRFAVCLETRARWLQILNACILFTAFLMVKHQKNSDPFQD